MNPAFIPFAILGFAGYIIGIVTLGPNAVARDDIHNAGLCVATASASPYTQGSVVAVSQPMADKNTGSFYCPDGQELIKVVPTGS